MLKINTLHRRKQNYTLHLANAALKNQNHSTVYLGGDIWGHLVQPIDQRKVNCKVNLDCAEPYPGKSVKMQIYRLSGHIAPVSL